MLQSLLAYARGAGVDARWLTIGGDEHFFRITKRIHNNLHGAPGDGGELGKPMSDVASGKAAAPFHSLAQMVLSHASEEGAVPDVKAPGAKSLVNNLKAMLAKQPTKAAA